MTDDPTIIERAMAADAAPSQSAALEAAISAIRGDHRPFNTMFDSLNGGADVRPFPSDHIAGDVISLNDARERRDEAGMTIPEPEDRLAAACAALNPMSRIDPDMTSDAVRFLCDQFVRDLIGIVAFSEYDFTDPARDCLDYCQDFFADLIAECQRAEEAATGAAS